jgi:hypothetical protein
MGDSSIEAHRPGKSDQPPDDEVEGVRLGDVRMTCRKHQETLRWVQVRTAMKNIDLGGPMNHLGSQLLNREPLYIVVQVEQEGKTEAE